MKKRDRKTNAQVESNGVLGTVVDNAVPLTLAAIGIAWFIGNVRGSAATAVDEAEESDERPRARLRLVKRGQQVASDTWHGAQRATSVVASRAKQGAGGVASQVSTQAKRVQGGVESAMRKNPLAVGAAALAAGAAVGLSVPVTRSENELLGDARDALLDRAQVIANDTFESIQHVAQSVADEAGRTLTDEAKQQGLLV